jgi:hypothetical protein
MPKKKRSKAAAVTPLISDAMLSEYTQWEQDPRWYFNLMGVIASREPKFWEWIAGQVKQDTLRLMGECPQAFLNPILAQELGKVLTRSYVRAHFLGVRKYEGSLANVFDILQMPNEPKPTAATPPLEDDTTLSGEVEPGDLEP